MSILIQFSLNNNILPNKFTLNNPLKSNLISLLKSLNNPNLLGIDLDSVDLYHKNIIITESPIYSENILEEICLIEIRENTQISGSKSQLSGHKGPILCINSLKTKESQNITIISGGSDKTVRIWRDGFMKYTINDHENWVQILKSRFINKTEIEIISGSMDGKVIYYLFNILTIKIIEKKIIGKFKEGVSNIEFYNNLIIASSRDKTLKIFNKESKLLSSYQHQSQIKGFIIHKDYIYSYCEKSLFIYKIIESTISFKYIKELKLNGVVTKMNYNNNLIIAGTKTGKLYFIEDLKVLFSISNHSNIISGIKFFRNYLVTSSFDKKLLIHDFKGKLIKEFITNFPIYSIDISSNFICVGGLNGIISLFNEHKYIRDFKCSDDIFDLNCINNRIIAASKDSNLYIFQ